MGEFLVVSDNLNQISKKLKLVTKRFPKEIDTTTKNVSNLVIGELQRNTPKHTLRRSKLKTRTRRK